jgi:hypothetical protein
VNAGVPTLAVTVTGKFAVVGLPQVAEAVARTVKFVVTLLTKPLAELIVAPPFTML